MSDKLKPCPFCGWGVEITDEKNYIGEHIYRIDCDMCETHTYAYHDKKNLINRWNHRPDYTNLKSCPLCGSNAYIENNRVMCNGCGAHTDEFDTQHEAVMAWNRRDEKCNWREKYTSV